MASFHSLAILTFQGWSVIILLHIFLLSWSLSHFGILIWLNHKPSSTCLFAYFHFPYYQMCSPFFIRVTGLAAYSPKKNESEERTATNAHTHSSSCISFLLLWVNPVLSAEQSCHFFLFCNIKISFSI
uniref:Uncharacterized protein n=1 Tax=Pipistrellus kuhlii TaxID=59472 RepID=A0A7J7X0A2_PIPKU|nr:hypothetical protein mPipKuh1_010806 [Pipistrellus kuhlii]